MRIVVWAAALAGALLPAAARAQTSEPAPAQPAPAQPAPVAAEPTPAAAAPVEEPPAPEATPAPGPAAAVALPAVVAVLPVAAAPLRWRGSLFFATVSMNTNTINPGQNLTQNSTVDSSYVFRPRFYLSNWFQIRGGFALNYEFTNSDSTTRQNELRASDTTLDLWFHGIPTIKGVKFWIAPRITLPSSLESQARTMYFSTSLVSQVAYNLEHFLGGDFTFVGNVTYSHPFYQYTTAGLRDGVHLNQQCVDTSGVTAAGTCGTQGSGLANVRDSVGWSLILAADYGIISPGVFFSMNHAWAYTFAPTPGVPNDPTAGNYRQSTTFAAWIDVLPTSWFTAEIGYSMSRNVLTGMSTYGNPIADPYQDMRLYVQAIFTLDKLYQAVFQGSNTGGGVIRTRNNDRFNNGGLVRF